MALRFEWDPNKAAANLAKHGVDFRQAVSVFADPLGVVRPDVAHSAYEMRCVLLGHSAGGRLLVVVFTDRGDTLIRLISARPATLRERRFYEEALG